MTQVADRRKTLVLFDVGGVLLSLDFRRFYEGAAALSGSLTSGEIEERYLASRIDFLACKGLVSKKESVRMLRSIIRPREPAPDERIESLLALCWKRRIDELVDLKRSVHRAGYSVGILSNITDIALEQIAGRFPEIFDVFDERSPRVYSFQVGFMKPELGIYRLIDGYERVIFIDDKEIYAGAPSGLPGWRGIWFTPYIDPSESLRAAHGDRGDVPPAEGFRRADSVDELKRLLGEFGVETGG